MSIYGVVGVLVGLLINFLVIRPIERKKIRKEILEQKEERMANLLIKNMGMPRNCFDCPFLRDDFCVVLGYEMRNDQILMGCGSCLLLR